MDNGRSPPLFSRGDGDGQRRGKERLWHPPIMPLSEPAEYFRVRVAAAPSWVPLRRPGRGLEGMLTAPPAAGGEEGREAARLLPPSIEIEEPPPLNVDNNEVEPELCSRRLSLPELSWLRPAEVRKVKEEEEEEDEGSDLRPGDRSDDDFRESGGRSEL